MAERRMFNKKITDSDEFLDMPAEAQMLYFHLSMHADDEGFVYPKSIMRMIGARDDSLRLLIAKRFVILFESGVIVIRHWRLNNYLRSDRYVETQFEEEKKSLKLVDKTYEENGLDTIGIPLVCTDKDRIGKDSIGKNIEESNSLRSLSSSCPEQSNESSEPDDDSQVFIEIPLIGGKSAKITESYVKQAEELYPAIDVRQTIRNAKGWLLDNPKNRKSDWKRFLGSWLRREQDKALRIPQSGQPVRKNIKAAPDYDPDQEVKVTKISFDEEDS